MNEWLSQRADALARVTGVDRSALELSDEDAEHLLDLAAHAAHDSDVRTNAPLLCYLVGVARTAGTPLDQLGETVRSTS